MEDTYLELLNKEADECIECIQNQHTQIQLGIKIYTASLFGFFAVSGFFLQQPKTSVESVAIGISIGTFVFLLGWLLLSMISHKVANLILYTKHLVAIRRVRLEKYRGNNAVDYRLPVNDGDINYPKSWSYLPSFFFGLNYAVLGGAVFFYCYNISPKSTKNIYLATNGWQALLFAFAAIAITGVVYPNSWRRYSLHYRFALKAANFAEKKSMETQAETASSLHLQALRLGRLAICVSAVAVVYFAVIFRWLDGDRPNLYFWRSSEAIGILVFLVIGQECYRINQIRQILGEDEFLVVRWARKYKILGKRQTFPA